MNYTSSSHLATLIVSGFGMLLLVGCVSTAKYTPAVKFSSPQLDNGAGLPIPVSVHMNTLVDVSPAEDKEDGWIYWKGWSVTSPERLKGSLDAALTDAIIGDFREHKTFDALGPEVRSWQLNMEGKVHRFYQRRENYLWGLCCGLLGMLLPFPLMKEEGAVDLELTLTQADGTLIKSYRGKSAFVKRCNFYESRCLESYNDSPAKYLDEAFGDSMNQIRRDVLKDRDFLVQRVSQSPR